MVQHIDIEFRERATSTPLNKRFRDITGPTVLSGYRLSLGTKDFFISLKRGTYASSVAIAPSGVRIEEDADLFDVISVEPNPLSDGQFRVDSVYLVYQFGSEGVPATYVVVKGVGGNPIPEPNPNPTTHLLLGYVTVPPQSAVPTANDLTSVEIGIHTLEVANSATFKGPATFKKEVIFDKPVRFLEGTIGAEDPNSSFIERLPATITAAPQQQEFTLPSSYLVGKNTLFVFKDWILQPPNLYFESSPTTFKFHEPLNGGEKIWAYWYRSLSFYTPEEHHHDALYYRKNEMNNRSLHHAEDYFAGNTGRVITHYLGTLNYVVIPPVPTDQATDVGEISIEKRENEIVVYNTGTYRGKFDIAYYVKHSYQYVPNNEDVGFFNIVSYDLDTDTHTYRSVDYKRSDGTLYLRTILENLDGNKNYRRMRLDFYNTSGNQVVRTQFYALDYDEFGMLYSKVLLP